MHHFVILFAYLLGAFLLSHARHTVSIAHDEEKTFLSDSEAGVCLTPACVIAAADLLTSLDKTMDPCDDFYSFTCGNWMKKQEVTEEEPGVNVFLSTQEDLNRKLRDLLESEYKSSDQPFVKILKDFYNTCMNVEATEEQGSEPLKKLIGLLGGGWPVVEGNNWDESSFDWVDTLISLRKLGLNFRILVDFYVAFDPRNETRHIIYIEEPYMSRLAYANMSLGLEDPQIAAYYSAMVKSAKLLGADESTAEMEMLKALNFEMDLTKISEFNETIGRENKTIMTIAELQEELPSIPLLKLINGLLLVKEVDENEIIVNGYPSFLVNFADLITSTDKRIIANYMMWRAVLESKNYLSKEWKDINENEEEDEDSKSSKKTKEEPRWKDCLSELKRHFEIGLSSYYIRAYFSHESKEEAMVMMKYIQKEFLKLLENNDWMDDKTREKAEDKAKAIKAYIGYPEELLNDTLMMEVYKGLTLTTDSYLEDILAINKWQKDFMFSRLRMATDDSIRKMTFHNILEVNAFYTPMGNRIEIPAGILHDAFYDKDKPEYMNFAEIGYIIGHEITHGFDNMGRHYDKDGNYVMWWDKVSDEHFLRKAKCIVDQYDNYTTFIGMKVNGEKTQNENIADNGGLKEAYLAYQSWTKDHGTEPLLPGVDYTQNQIFWLSAARAWCSKYIPEKLKELLLTDSHSPAKYRIIGPMSNLEEFSKDFKCSADAPMNRKYKCEVW